ncbi:hypothetical protein C0989_008806 [Termitomyces sp. Mn162]|nr:hypothetical protein C0989_008806 [Termitomyces sp. Mn162]
MGLNGDGLVVAFGDFNGDQFLDVLWLGKDQHTISVHYWNHAEFVYQEASSFRHPRRVHNVVPGDFTHSGKLDILVMSESDTKGQLDMTLYPASLTGGFDVNHPLNVPPSTLSQPIPIDANGDMKIDLFGLTPASKNDPKAPFQLWQNVWNASQPDSPLFKIISPAFHGPQCTLASPHSNAIVDLDGDCLADVFVVCDDGEGSKSFQIWVNKKENGFSLAQEGNLPSGLQTISFGDIDRDGTIDMFNLSDSPNNDLFVRFPLSALFSDSPSLLALDTTQTPPIPLSLKLGDANLDGFPDILLITGSGKDRIPRLIFSKPCAAGLAGCSANGSDRRGWELAKSGADPLSTIKDARSVAFLDVDEDGTLDIMIQRTGDAGHGNIIFVQNNYYYDAFFLKAIGRTNNYIENLFVGSTIHAKEHYINMEGVIPNSKVVILPSADEGEPWKRELFLRPGEWIPWVTVTVVAGTIVLAVIVFVLHLNEKPSGYDEGLLEPLQEDMLTFDDAESGWERYPTPKDYIEAPQEWLLFGGPLSAPLPIPARITREVGGPLACPRGGKILELPWDESDTWLEDINETPNMPNFFENAPLNHVNVPARQPRRNSGKREHRGWDCSPTAPSFCPLAKSKVAEIPKQTRVSLRRSSIVKGH